MANAPSSPSMVSSLDFVAGATPSTSRGGAAVLPAFIASMGSDVYTIGLCGDSIPVSADEDTDDAGLPEGDSCSAVASMVDVPAERGEEV